MSVVMKEIERRQIEIASYEMKIEKAAKLRAEAEILEKEVANTDVTQLAAEIHELTEDAIKLGYIDPPVPDEETEEAVEADDESVGYIETT